MKMYIKLLLLPMVLASSSLFAASQLTLTEGVNLLVINGEKFQSEGSFLNRSNSIALQEGENQLLISFTAEIKKGSETELESSDPVVVSFKVDNQNVSFDAPEIKSQSHMRSFNQKQNWILKDSKQNVIELSVTLLPLKGFRIGVDYEREMERYNRKNNINVANNLSNKIAPAVVVDADATEQAVILKMLQNWYQLASPETQQQFLQSIK